MDIQKLLVQSDKICDYIPVLSTITNFVDLFQKYIVLPMLHRPSIETNRYFAHLDKKSPFRCVLLMIPGLNIYMSIHTKKQAPTAGKLQQQIENETEETRLANDKREKLFDEIKQFVLHDTELQAKFKECLQQTGEILLKPATMGEIDSSLPQVVAEWQKEKLRSAYYDALETRFNDFMDKNPEFKELFTKKLEEMRRGKK